MAHRLAIPMVLLGVFGSAQADSTTPPNAVMLVEAIGDHNAVSLQLVDVAGAKSTTILDKMPLGVTERLAVDAASRRWAMSFHQLANGDPLLIDGKAVSRPSDVAAIVVGEAGKPGVTVLAGDPKCTSKKTACFETPLRFLKDGSVLLTKSENSGSWMWNQRAVKAGATPTPVVDASLAKVTEPSLGHDGVVAAYVAKTGLFVTKGLVANATSPIAKLVASKKAVGAPQMIMSPLGVAGDRAVFYFRRDPANQKVGFIAAWDLKANKEVEVLRFPEEFPMWDHRFLFTPVKTRMIFQHDAAYERAELYEVGVDTLAAPRKFASDVKELLDVSADGAYALCSTYPQPDPKLRDKKSIPEQVLVVIEIATGKEVKRIVPSVKIPKIYDARFVATP